ncbi:MAG: hypothetical protein COW00_16600 [Bdellovibrio sp. CG12_big_fil_rev_8_21_14_0_65_39_13]|nr:MAG: hypothetical protein COW78_09890 [Bdellovibrio sp. CG22_combo_CG10-13_8_21_14_all_39_27]PIQ58228.1 MAG: hypothetical protein COW00_16600 [Bdellovibrio sp. CG12_big_fil_rev_8_21_14_0_65_39_13]PIR36637.1 MAG: hypothetical protein COV37_02120 [Bdellovibrio sp. CG11_big_fil_rev_8_21_14_0_20_39_38]
MNIQNAKSENLIPTLDPVSMKRTLQGLKAREKEIFAWQNIDNQRISMTISTADFILGEKLFIFNKEVCKIFQESKPLYFFAGPNTIIFKAQVLAKKNEHLVIEYPESMQIEESRDTKRFYFKQNFKFLNVSKKNKNSTPTRYRVSLFDISESGASFTLNDFQKQNIDSKDSLKLHSIDDQILSPYLNAEIKYIVPFRVMGTSLHKVGIQFDRLLTPSELKTII